jgi:N-sulfoglucosamine sulfohydrolase
MTKKPNVLMFIPHDLGDFLSCYGHEDVISPNLDRLADDGVKFNNYFAVAPECTTSRSCMLTGQYPHQNGLVGLAHFGWKLNDPGQHLAARMRDNGYETFLFGAQHETSGPGEELGYMNCFRESAKVENVCSSVCDFLRQHKDEDSPWFIHAGFHDVHRRWDETTSFRPEDVILPPYLPDKPEVRREYTLFYQSIMNMDAAIGRVIDELDKSGLRENTLVIFTTDHGSPFPRAKSTLYDPGIRIPLIMSHPDFKKGQSISALCSNLDYSPTVMDFCNMPLPSGIEGESMMPLLSGETDILHSEIYGAVFFDVSYDPMYYVRDKDYKYIRSFGVDKEEAADIHPEIVCSYQSGQWIRLDDYDVMVNGADTWNAIGKSGQPPPKEELYNLKEDPLELNNLVDNPEYARQLEHMSGLLHSMLKRTNAPVPGNHIKPTVAQINGTQKHLELMGLNKKH